MSAAASRLRAFGAATLLCVLAGLVPSEGSLAAAPGQQMIPYLQHRFGLNEPQVRGALGALLVYARDRLPKPDFDDFAARIPNADRIMQEVKLRGIVTGPLDDI